ncbi:hypothetical protein AYI68_g3351 [Smittium mucronatum]|uniref:PH domain-containing protein n=1 Tax=Smittium mucronatum TaxID=133383 RepID=A0A1R0H081_9FUNG|nr:hypothetical protein AYI68_g3351 [Smittium mucronatum]
MTFENNARILKNDALTDPGSGPYNDLDLISINTLKKIYNKRKVMSTSRFRFIYSNIFAKHHQRILENSLSVKEIQFNLTPTGYTSSLIKLDNEVYISNIFHSPVVICEPILHLNSSQYFTQSEVPEISQKLLQIDGKKFSLLKATTNKFHNRTFHFDFSQQRIIWNSKKKHVSRAVDLESVYEFRFGQSAFDTLRTQNTMSTGKREFSIVLFFIQGCNFKTLTLFASNVVDFNDWVFSLKLYALNKHPVRSINDLKRWEAIVKKRQKWEQEIQTKQARLNFLVNKYSLDSFPPDPNCITPLSQKTNVFEKISIYDKFESNKTYYTSFYNIFSNQRKSWDDLVFGMKNPLLSFISEELESHKILLSNNGIIFPDFKKFILNVQKVL